MSPEPQEPASEPVPLPGQLVASAKDWMDGKTAKEACMELYVRWIQLAGVMVRICAQHGQDLDGEPISPREPHPAPSADELRQWLSQLVPPGSGGTPPGGS